MWRCLGFWPHERRPHPLRWSTARATDHRLPRLRATPRTVIREERPDGQRPDHGSDPSRACPDARRGRRRRPRRSARRGWCALSGVGNISAALVSDGATKRMVSHNGTAGHVAPRIREFTYPFAGQSDASSCIPTASRRNGISPPIPVSPSCQPSLIAGVLYPRFPAQQRRCSIVVAARRHDMTHPPPRHRDRAGARHRPGAPAHASDRGAARLRRAGSNAHHHGGVRDRAQRDRIRQRRAHRISARPATAGANARNRRPRQRARHRRISTASSTGVHRSTTGMGIGILGARRLMDAFAIETAARAGHHDRDEQALAARAYATSSSQSARGRSARRWRKEEALDPIAEIRRQNQEMLRAARRAERQRNEQLAVLNQELQDTNRGVVALYAELERARRSSAPGRRAEIALPVEYEPRVPHAAQFDPGAVAPAASRADGDLIAGAG